jgi:hypothetical protein
VYYGYLLLPYNANKLSQQFETHFYLIAHAFDPQRKTPAGKPTGDLISLKGCKA